MEIGDFDLKIGDFDLKIGETEGHNPLHRPMYTNLCMIGPFAQHCTGVQSSNILFSTSHIVYECCRYAKLLVILQENFRISGYLVLVNF